MPIYQYDCEGCDQRVDVFFRSANSASDAACPECGSADLSRVMSAFARNRSGSDRLDSIDFSQEMGRLGGGNERDFAKWAKRMGREYDGELGSNFSELAEKAESGDDPIELWREYQRLGSDELRNQLVEHYLPIVRYTAERLRANLPQSVEPGFKLQHEINKTKKKGSGDGHSHDGGN